MKHEPDEKRGTAHGTGPLWAIAVSGIRAAFRDAVGPLEQLFIDAIGS